MKLPPEPPHPRKAGAMASQPISPASRSASSGRADDATAVALTSLG